MIIGRLIALGEFDTLLIDDTKSNRNRLKPGMGPVITKI